MGLPQEQPPVEEQDRLSEWLTRLVILINGELDLVHDFEPSILPIRPVNGMQRYFNSAILPDITHPGLWFYHDGWLALHAAP